MSEILTFAAITISLFAVILATYMIYLSATEIVNSNTRYAFITVLLGQILLQILLNITFQIRYALIIENLVILILLISCFGQVSVTVCILGIFSVLDSRITPQRLKIFKYSTFGVFSVFTAPTLASTIGFPLSVVPAEFLTFFVVILTGIIEQSAAVYLTLLIFRHGKAIPKHKQLPKSIMFLAAQTLVDYIGYGIEVYQIYSSDGSSYEIIPNKTASLYQIIYSTATIHSAFSVYSFILFKRLFIAGHVEKKVDNASSPQLLLDVVKAEKQLKSEVQTEEFKKTVIMDKALTDTITKPNSLNSSQR